jgi:D-arginine dehydrogenase
MLAEQARVTVLEAEEAIGFHSSGRSATMLHYALGDPLVRAMTLASRDFFDNPPDAFSEAPIATPMPILVHARASELSALDEAEADLAPFTELDRLDADGLAQACPLLRVGPDGSEYGMLDRHALRLDGHALLQGHARRLKRSGAELVTSARIAAIERVDDAWTVTTERGEKHSASVLVNAAGAWADQVAILAGAAPIGLEPKRRTIIVFDAPEGADLASLPFVKTVGDELYFGREAGRIFASPMDEVPSDPCDAQADEYEMALAAQRVEERTVMTVERIVHRWAGLRTFAPDRRLVAGFAPDAPGFFWLAGQGGFGLQTSPAMAAVTAALILGRQWPVTGITVDQLSPVRFFG